MYFDVVRCGCSGVYFGCYCEMSVGPLAFFYFFSLKFFPISALPFFFNPFFFISSSSSFSFSFYFLSCSFRQATTLDWLWGLLQQILVSGFFVRPMQILIFTGLLPGMILQLGLCLKYRKKHQLKAEKNKRKTQEQKKIFELVQLNKMLVNPMLNPEKQK